MSTDNTKTLKITSALHQPFFDRLANSTNCLIAGCGGGYDFFSAIPLYLSLEKAGLNVYLANLTFTNSLHETTARKIGPNCYCVNEETKDKDASKSLNSSRSSYFPELLVAKFFKKELNKSINVYTFERSGVTQMLQSYQAVVDELKIDTIILADGGTDR